MSDDLTPELKRQMEQVLKQSLQVNTAGQHPDPRGGADYPNIYSVLNDMSQDTNQPHKNYGTPSHTMTNTASGGGMQDLPGYKDLSRPPQMGGAGNNYGNPGHANPSHGAPETLGGTRNVAAPSRNFESAAANFAAGGVGPDAHDFSSDYDTEFSGNVKTLIRLVNDLPDGVTKQTGAQIIRLTMEAMGISMEEVLSEAQSAQSEMLEGVRANIKKIEEYKTVIRKLETDIKYFQGRANELSEIIDLFILSNVPKTSGIDDFSE